MFIDHFDSKITYNPFVTNMPDSSRINSLSSDNLSHNFTPKLDDSSVPIYFNIYNRSLTMEPFGDINQNMKSDTSTNPSPLGEVKAMTSDIIFNAFELIRKNRCNTVLDLQGQVLSPEEWEAVQSCILNTTWLPPIKQIDLRETGLSYDLIDDKLRSIIVL